MLIKLGIHVKWTKFKEKVVEINIISIYHGVSRKDYIKEETKMKKERMCSKIVATFCTIILFITMLAICFNNSVAMAFVKDVGKVATVEESLEKIDVLSFEEFTKRYTDEDKNAIFEKLENNQSASLLSNSERINERVLYDLAGRPTYGLQEFVDGGYQINNRLTGNSIELTEEGDTPYKGYYDYKLYYSGFGNYFALINGELVDLQSQMALTENDFAFLSEFSDYLAISEYVETNNEVSQQIGSSAGLLTTNTEREQYSTIMSGGSYFENLKASYDSDGTFYTSTIYLSNADGTSDLLFPHNFESSCGIVAIVQLMQYYERNGTHVIPQEFSVGKQFPNTMVTNGSVNIFWKNVNAAGYFSQVLHNEIDDLTWGGLFGENYTKNLMTGIEKFYEKYPANSGENLIKIVPKYNTCYDNMKGAVDSGRPAIGMTSTGNGYYKVNGSWTSTEAARHQMVVYGYCTTKNGTLKDFICHSGWHVQGTSKMYVYKLNFLSNFTHTLS